MCSQMMKPETEDNWVSELWLGEKLLPTKHDCLALIYSRNKLKYKMLVDLFVTAAKSILSKQKIKNH